MKNLFFVTLLMVMVMTACGKNPQPMSSTSTPATNLLPTVTVTAPAPVTDVTSTAATGTLPVVAPIGSPSNCTDSASFVQDLTVQDNEMFLPGQKFDKIWRVKNTGTCTWTDQYMLAFFQGDQMNAPALSPLAETLSGNMLDIKVSMSAPNDETVTRAQADYEIRNPAGGAIPIDAGTTLWVIIQVANGDAPKHDPLANTGPGYANATCSYTTDPAKVNEAIAALNAYRAQQGLAPYTINNQLTESAQAHSADMACNQLFYHNGSNGSTAKSRVAASGYIATAVTENVYGSYPPLNGQGVINWWANDVADPRHNENLLSTRYIEIGVAYAFYNNYGYYVIDFAVP
jgi:uncharacterized protein YkwD